MSPLSVHLTSLVICGQKLNVVLHKSCSQTHSLTLSGSLPTTMYKYAVLISAGHATLLGKPLLNDKPGDMRLQLAWHGLLKAWSLRSALISVHFKLLPFKTKWTWIPHCSKNLSYGPLLGFCHWFMWSHSCRICAGRCFHTVSLQTFSLITIEILPWWPQAIICQSSCSSYAKWDVECVFLFSPSLFQTCLNELKRPFHHVRHGQSLEKGLRLSDHLFFSVYPSPRASDVVKKCSVWWKGWETT